MGRCKFHAEGMGRGERTWGRGKKEEESILKLKREKKDEGRGSS